MLPTVSVKRPRDRLIAAEFAGEWSILRSAATMSESASRCDLLSGRESVCRDDGNDTYGDGRVDTARMAELSGRSGFLDMIGTNPWHRSRILPAVLPPSASIVDPTTSNSVVSAGSPNNSRAAPPTQPTCVDCVGGPKHITALDRTGAPGPREPNCFGADRDRP